MSQPTPRALLAAFSASLEVETPGAQNWVPLATVGSYTSTGTEYRVAARVEHSAVVMGCSCPDWVYRRRASRGQCKHLKALCTTRGRDLSRVHSYPEATAYLTKGGRVFFQVLQVIAGVQGPSRSGG